MAAPAQAPNSSIVLSSRQTRRDLKVSLGILVAGIVLYAVGWFAVSREESSNLTGGGSSAGTTFLLLQILFGAGGVMIVVGGIFTGVNAWLLRRRLPTRETNFESGGTPGLSRDVPPQRPGPLIRAPVPRAESDLGCEKGIGGNGSARPTGARACLA